MDWSSFAFGILAGLTPAMFVVEWALRVAKKELNEALEAHRQVQNMLKEVSND